MVQFHIPKMSCGGCVASVTKAVKGVDAGANVYADLATKLVTVDTQVAPAVLASAITAAGYPAELRLG